jgi:sortase A
MRPDEPNNRRVGTPLVPQRSILHTPQSPARDETQHATANVVRGQLNHIYGGNTTTPTPQTTPVAQPIESPQQSIEAENPYHRTQHNPHEVQAEQWKKYHSAWQDYYQKYYERYYVGQVHSAKQALEAKTAHTQPTPTENGETITPDEAMYDLRSKVRTKVKESAKKVRGSRHFVPITAALCVMVVFLFLQYNRVLFANVEAYVSPGNIDPVNIIVDPSTSVAVSPEPKLIIPKINVEVPIEFNTTPDYNAQMKAMENGVAWFGIPGANSKPGQVGNTVLSGHSSNDIIDGGSYKFIFARLEQMNTGDTIYVNYEGKRYTYTVTKKEVVKPTEVNKLVYPADKPILTLITCTPLGTALNRLLVTAEQVSPNPKEASQAPVETTSSSEAMPGNSPTFIQRLFGAR